MLFLTINFRVFYLMITNLVCSLTFSLSALQKMRHSCLATWIVGKCHHIPADTQTFHARSGRTTRGGARLRYTFKILHRHCFAVLYLGWISYRNIRAHGELNVLDFIFCISLRNFSVSTLSAIYISINYRLVWSVWNAEPLHWASIDIHRPARIAHSSSYDYGCS